MAHRNNRSLLQTLIPPRPKLYEKNMEKGYANNNMLVTQHKFLRTLMNSLEL